MLIYLKVYVEWLKMGTCWNLKNSGFSICTSLIISWTSWNDYVAATASSIIETTSLADIISSIWMLSIT
jgi:hypothetical protein